MNAISYTSSFWLSMLLALNAAAAFQWSPTPQNGEVLYSCADQSVTMAWNYTLAEGDVIISTVWNFQGRSQEMVAFSAQGNFIPIASFSQRVQHVPHAGILLRHVTKGDAGNYSVTVTGTDSSGASFTMHRTVLLQVADALMTTDHELHAGQQPVAEWNNATQDWHAVVTCGTFTYTADPPVWVEWQTPEGQTVTSTLYSQGLFKLQLPNPVVEGSYSCRISASTQNLSCTHGHGQQASVTVDGILTRLTLMEGRQVEKDAEINQLSMMIDRLRAEKDTEISQISSKLTEKDTEISQISSKLAEKDTEISQMSSTLDGLQAKGIQKDADISNLTTKVETLEANFHILKDHSPPPPIAFSATLTGTLTLGSGSTLVLPGVLVNHGDAYNSSTGRFTAPLGGIYYFSAMTTASRSSSYVGMYLISTSNGQLFTSYTYSDGHYQSGSLQGAVHLHPGEQVWLVSSYADTYFRGPSSTAFSGFLLFPVD